MEPGQQVEVAEPDRRGLGDPHLDLLLPALLRARGRLVGRQFDWNAANFTPLVMGVLLIAITIAWVGGMNKRYKGPDPDDLVRRGHGHHGGEADRRSRLPSRPPPPASARLGLAHPSCPRPSTNVFQRSCSLVRHASSLLRLDRAVDRE